MTTIDRNTARKIHRDIDDALLQISARYGLKNLRTGRLTFSSTTMSARMEGITENGLTKEALKYNTYRITLELPALGTQFQVGSSLCTTAGLNRTNTKVLGVNVADSTKMVWIGIEMLKRAETGNMTLTPCRPRRNRANARSTQSRAQRPAPTPALPVIGNNTKPPMGFPLSQPNAKLPEPPKSGQFAIDI